MKNKTLKNSHNCHPTTLNSLSDFILQHKTLWNFDCAYVVSLASMIHIATPTLVSQISLVLYCMGVALALSTY